MWRALLPALIGAALPASAQQAPSPPPAAAAEQPATAPHEPVAGQSATLPPAAVAEPPGYDLTLQSTDQRMTVPVVIAGAGPFRFVIDTGAERTVISRELADQLGLPKGREIRVTALTGTSIVGTVIIPSISVSTLGGQRIEAPAFLAKDIGASGLLGVDALQGHRVRIDLDQGVMSVSAAQKRSGRVRRDPDEVIVRAKSRFGQLVVTDANVDGVRVRVVLDTGTPVSIGNEALRRRLPRGGRITGSMQLISVTGETLVTPYGAAAAMQLGPMSIRNLPIAFAQVTPFQVFGLDTKPAMLLGMDALRLFRRVDIDFANRELRMLVPEGTAKGRNAG